MLRAFIVLVVVAGVAQAGWQSIGIQGTLKCGNKPASDVKVEIWEEDTFDPNDVLVSVKTDRNGKFSLFGSENEVGSIKPYLKIYHNCVDGLMPCDREWKFNLPSSYIESTSGKPNKYLDIGTWNLEIYPQDEERDCIN